MLNTCRFFFHGSLKDFLLRLEKEHWITHAASPGSSVKAAIEAIGVPHVEVMETVMNGSKTAVDVLLAENASVEVFPYPHCFSDKAPITFVLDVHLGKLARLLRLLGIDCVYQNMLTDHEIVSIAVAQNRAVLTRDIGLLKHKVLSFGYWLRSQYPEQQLAEVIRWFSLCPHLRPFSRCIVCNGLLCPIAKEEIRQDLPQKTEAYFEEFYRCDSCRKVYWKGSHYQRMLATIEQVRSVTC
jgi:uncharacterized protein with PIN domain